ncbi:MAG: two-component system response regulator [Aquabacterium sp.]|jgi:putative two-component system response regulator|uniref:response regulator n=1 Tax=Aquabacterium sp. TaxID=1872578 RepID=UPI002A35C6B2|nr:two-component system response regulator [Aquabacterium sp.]MDX9843701.1 two-component system response regulator [Aquabacterium sp.]
MTVLVVDDTKENLTVIGQLLRPYYHVRVANSGLRALQAVAVAPRPDLILLDVMMPEMDGYEVLKTLRANPACQDIPVIFVTALSADTDEELGLSLGAVDYVTKPVKPALLLARVRAQLELKKARDWLADQNAYLDAEVHRRMAENELIKDVSLHALAALAEKRDNETGNHLHRTQGYVALLIELLREHPRFQTELADEAYCGRVVKAAPLHDIGKVGIPDAILLKPGKLTPDEFEVMKTHAMIGAQALEESIKLVQVARAQRGVTGDADVDDSALDFLEVARQIAGGHHEKWDGSGYPSGLRGDAIPVPARLMAVADVFDALISRRHYKQPFAADVVLQIMREGRGRHFDPDVADAFLQHLDRFEGIANRFKDEHPEDLGAFAGPQG